MKLTRRQLRIILVITNELMIERAIPGRSIKDF